VACSAVVGRELTGGDRCVKVYTMPSLKPLIALRLERPLYERVVAIAQQQGRTPANFIAQQLRVSLMMTPAGTKQLDLVDAIAAAVKRGPVKPSRHK
jgi:hypothetical protein